MPTSSVTQRPKWCRPKSLALGLQVSKSTSSQGTGNVTAMLMYLSPVPTFYSICKRKDTGQFSPFPYLCTLNNCILWLFYGFPFISKNNILVITINGAGVVIETTYLLLFLYYAVGETKLRCLRDVIIVLSFCAVVLGITCGVWSDLEGRQTFLGSINVVINALMYFAPLSVLKMVIETQSVEYMPFLLSLCGFISACLWCAYGICQKDKFIIIPNGLGVLFGALQLALYARYRNSTPVDKR